MSKTLRQPRPVPQQLALPLDVFLPPAPSAPSAAPASPAAPPPAPLQSQPPASPPRPGARRIRLQEHLIEYGLQRSKRRSIGFVIDDDGLRVTAPRWVSLAQVEEAIRDKQRWILAKLAERQDQRARRLHPSVQWQDGATLPYLGQTITLRVLAGQHESISYDGQRRELTLCLPAAATAQQLKDRVQGWLQGEARKLFAERLPLYAQKLGVSYRSFTLSSATTQWGSCSADGRIRLNWRLMHFAPEQIDYVIAHELAHLLEMNHGPRFWAAVQSVFPEFAAARKILRQRGPEILF